jgi:DNA polymerase-1
MLRGGYSLAALSYGWLCEDISSYEASLQPYLHRNKDYGRIPADIIGAYACQDVLTVRRLDRYIAARIPEQCRQVEAVEIKMTTILFEMERTGMYVNPTELKIEEFRVLNRLSKIDDELEAIVGRSFRPHVNDDCFDVLCNQYGLPILSWTNDDDPNKPHNPSFDKDALVQYSHHPYAPKDVVRLMQEYRHLNQFRNLFLVPYQELHVDGLLHPTYNQAIRTGRLSCKQPNAMQLCPEAKALVRPGKGEAILSTDASQIEFRIIVHYIQNDECTAAYLEDPDTDFHTWVAEMVGMARKPAKNVNFAMGYGQGRKSTVTQLAGSMEIVGVLEAQVDQLMREGKVTEDQRADVFNVLCTRKAEKVYRQYHQTLPELKPTAYRAGRACKAKGHVFNLYGRHRHLPLTLAHRAFNTLCQSSAADMVKERMVALHEALKAVDANVEFMAQVHDEVALRGPAEVMEDPRTKRDIVAILEEPACDLRVPLRWDIGSSRVNWLEASNDSDGKKLVFRDPKASSFTFLDNLS